MEVPRVLSPVELLSPGAALGVPPPPRYTLTPADGVNISSFKPRGELASPPELTI